MAGVYAQAQFWRSCAEGEGVREGPSLSAAYFPSEGDARQPCRRRVVAQVVQRAEMTRIAPECILPRVVQAGLKVRMVTGPQKAGVGLAEEDRRWKLLWLIPRVSGHQVA